MTEEFFWRKESAQNIQRKKINDNNHSPVHTNITNLEPKTRDFIMKEILNTEQNFVDNLSILNEDFIKPLSEILRKEDKECVFMNIDKIIDFHMLLKDNLEEACKGGEGRSKRICGVFELLFNVNKSILYKLK